MPVPSTTEEFLELVRKSGVVEEKRLDAYLGQVRASGKLPEAVGKAAGLLVHDGIVTHFQAEQFLQGRWRRFTIGKYKVLERIGSGGMGSVYLCEHKFMRRRAAVKVLPSAKANDPSALERFYREARAVAALDHPNIVRAYDIDQEEQLHFLVMEYVDGTSLQDIVKKSGPLDPIRAAGYIGQAAQGLQHAHEAAGLVHRDIKPGNLIVDRGGTVKILDMGLARFFNDADDLLTKKYDENVLGTADYLAPEQALDSHGVDIRADIYGLGATFYFCLTGKPPFGEGSVAQKLIWHQTRQPKPIAALRSDVPPALCAVVEKMMAKDPEQRYQQPLEVIQALASWTQAAPAAASNDPQPAARATGNGSAAAAGDAAAAAAKRAAAAARLAKNWEVKTPGRPAAPARLASAPAVAPLPDAPAAPAASSPPPQSCSPSLPASVADPLAQEPAAGGEIEELTVPAAAAGEGDEESLCWEKLAADTAELTAQGDTAPRSTQKAGRRPAARLPATRRVDQRRIWWIVGIVSGVFLLLLAIVLLWAFWPAPVAVPARPPGPARRPSSYRVGHSGPLHKIADALRLAHDQDRIFVEDNTIEEILRLDGKQTKVPAVTIEPAEGNNPVWGPPREAGSSKHLLYLSNVGSVHIHGFTFNGGDRVDDLVVLTGRCPGLTLEDLHLNGFKNHAIRIINCAGSSDQPVILSGLWLQHSTPCDAAMHFEVNPGIREPHGNENFVVRNCWFLGSYKSPVQLPTRDPKASSSPKVFLRFSNNSVREPDRPPEKGKPRALAQSVALNNPED